MPPSLATIFLRVLELTPLYMLPNCLRFSFFLLEPGDFLLEPGDFFADPEGKGRTLFWDFLKNLSLGAGFLLLIIGTDGSGLQPFLDAPFASSHPYGR